jgi:hypothetical protein
MTGINFEDRYWYKTLRQSALLTVYRKSGGWVLHIYSELKKSLEFLMLWKSCQLRQDKLSDESASALLEFLPCLSVLNDSQSIRNSRILS